MSDPLATLAHIVISKTVMECAKQAGHESVFASGWQIPRVEIVEASIAEALKVALAEARKNVTPMVQEMTKNGEQFGAAAPREVSGEAAPTTPEEAFAMRERITLRASESENPSLDDQLYRELLVSAAARKGLRMSPEEAFANREQIAAPTPHSDSLPIDGVWLRGEGDEINVYLQVAGDWYLAISESKCNPETISHVAEPRGIHKWPKLKPDLTSDE